MNQDEALEKLDDKIERCRRLVRFDWRSPEFKKWHRDSTVMLERIFGEKSKQQLDFCRVQYSDRSYMSGRSRIVVGYTDGLEEAVAILTSIKEEVIEYGLESCTSSGPVNPLATIELLCGRFHTVARQLRNRRENRETLDITDEYDVQDLFHALLRIHFLDVRPEEWTPSYAGNSSKMDFLLKPEQIVVEVKKTRQSMADKDLVDQLVVDVERYESHPDCKQLVCFVYDPDGRINNPTAIISDLEGKQRTLPLRVYVFPVNE